MLLLGPCYGSGETVKNEKGFTVIELVIASIILVLVLGAAYSIFESSVYSWIKGQNKVDNQQNVRIVLDRIVREVREAQELTETGDTYLWFKDYDGREITYYFEEDQSQIRRNVDGSGHTIVGDGITDVEFERRI